MALIDFHCHLQDAGGYRALADGQHKLFSAPPVVVSVTNQPSDWRALSRRNAQTGGVAWALGLHPEIRHTKRDLDQFTDCAPLAEAIGEVGLDYGRSNEIEHVAQRAVLEHVLGHPAVQGRILTLHSRGATTELLRMLADYRPSAAILHWFLGSPDDIDTAIDLDLFFSINDHMASSTRGKEVIALLPPNRVLLETDAPWGARGGGAKPGQFDKTVRHLAKVWLRTSDSTQGLIESNQRAYTSRLSIVPPMIAKAVAEM